ncbi:MAG: hypothetical protein BJ554DRAFT_6934 [Olpidium bornovanus]|uniref:FH2 domain-containing protein n=1 Tax=Olpidium bornovanus TaxID=278681 RepID=A0A8H7ZXA8_9FUNG|nr:MAG: hypothetical protein BJ554DRAFT_6934 [Olpidium bornovanus]
MPADLKVRLRGGLSDFVRMPVLQIILALGNIMNTGQRGGAYGFKLESLLKLGDTKSTLSNRKHTLLHYLVDLVQLKFPETAGFPEELAPLESGAKVSIPALRQTLVHVRTGLKKIGTLLESSAASKGGRKADDHFVPIMREFYLESEARCKALDESAKKAIAGFEQAVAAYAEDPKTATPEEFFGIFCRFAQSFQQAAAENEAIIAKAAEEAKKEEQRRQREEQRTKRKKEGEIAVSPTTAGSAAEQEGGFDDLISAIRSGKAFGQDFKPGRPACGKKAKSPTVG